MSSPSAIATVTATLQNLLTAVTTTVTTKPPASARNGGTGEQLNVFLYSVAHSPAFRNAPMPHQSRDGERSHPPLALVLKYMVTAYGLSDDDISGQELMGKAMSLLHDHPLLGPSDIQGITPDSNLQNQVERVRITPDTLSLDDMSKLWSSFQSADYHLSVAYEVSVVLIESDRPARTPLPVLKRGEDDRGAWTDVEVHTGADGAPTIRLHGQPTDIAVSLSHDGGTAMAVVARRTDLGTTTLDPSTTIPDPAPAGS